MATDISEQYKTKGNDFYTAKDYYSAIDWYTRAITVASGVAAYYGNRAAAYIAINKFTDALEDAQTSIRLDPKFTKGYMRLGKCHTSRGEYEEAEVALKKALALEPSNAVIKSEMELNKTLSQKLKVGEAALAAGDYDKALLAFSGILTTTPMSLSAKRGSAQCYVAKKNYTTAQENIRDVLAAYPTDEVALLVRAQTMYYTGNVEGAVKVYQSLLADDPDSAKIMGLLKRAREITRQKDAGDRLFKEGNHLAAAEAYTKALEADPTLDLTNSKIYCNRAGCYSALKRWEDALTDCNQAIILDEKYVRAYVRRAKCHTALEKYQEAVYDYGKAKELDPNNQEVLTALREAQKSLKKAQRKDYYGLLEISQNASDAEIKKAYRLQALKWHPDKHNETPESYAAAEIRFKDITEANSVLSDPRQRARYDSGADLEEDDHMGGGFGGFGGSGFSPDMFAQFFQAAGGGGGGGGGFGGGGFGGGGFGGGFPGGGFPFAFGGDDDDDHYHQPPPRRGGGGSHRGGKRR